MISISASEFQRNFGRYKEVAQKEAVVVTSYHRDSVVLISADEYERFKTIEASGQTALYAWELGEDELDELEAAINTEDGQEFNAEYTH